MNTEKAHVVLKIPTMTPVRRSSQHEQQEVEMIFFLSFTPELIVLWQKANEVVVELSNIVKT